MPSPLRVLILEDRPADAELMLYELRRAGLSADAQRVETEADYAAALDPALDLILADYTLPQFNALRALQQLQQRGLDIPFIIVTGSVSEETAVECLQLGAADYLLKDRLARLGQAVTRALDQKRLRGEKQQAERALVDNEKLFRALIEHSSDVVNLIGADRTILYSSPAITPVLGYTIEEYVSHNAFEFVHPDEQRDILPETALHAKTPGQIATFTYRLRHKDGSWRWVEGVSQNMLHEPSVRAVVVNFRDITERKQAEADLQLLNAELEQRVIRRTAQLAAASARLTELDRLKSKFVSDVSHELRTPVANLRLYIDLLEQGKPEKVAAYVATLKQQAKRLSTLVEAILDLSRLEQRKDPVTYQALALNPIVEQVVMAHLPRVAASPVQLTFEPGVNLPLVRGDANQLAQVMTNLVANALNYTLAGRIQITTYQIDQRVYVQVSDTGLGIQPDDLPHIFERFYRGQNVSHTGISGTGLGLAIVKEIIDLHQGDIEVESQDGAGATFRVWLPVAASDRPAPQ